jgi:hypothetical protein
MRLPLAAAVTDVLGNSDLLRFGVEDGRVLVVSPGGDMFRLNPSQTADVIAALNTLGWAAEMQRADARKATA